MKGLPVPLRIAVVLSGAVTLGTLLLTIAHLGITIPLFSGLGPQGDAVPQAATAFAINTVLFGLVTVGLYRRHRGALVAGIVLSALIIAMSVGQFRGLVSAVGIALSGMMIVLLLAGRSRQAVRS